MVGSALDAAASLSGEGVSATVVNCRFLKPYDRDLLMDVLQRHDAVLTVEEGASPNGFGAFIAREILEDPSLRMPAAFGSLGLPDRFVEHGSREVLLAEAGLDENGIIQRVRLLLGRDAGEPRLENGDASARESA
jgi:1-deoxy-D-xylulose-5-phosphate synthase